MLTKTKAPSEIYGNILSFLSPKDALNIVKTKAKLALITLRHYPWDLGRARVCAAFSKENMEILKYNTKVSQDSLLTCAASKGMLPLSKKLLETGKISSLTKNKVLVDVSENDNLNLVKLLLLHGANPSYEHSSALFVSIEYTNIVEELLKDPRTDPNSIYVTSGEIGEHPLMVASETNEDVLKILLDYPSKYPGRKISYPRDVYVAILYNASWGNDLNSIKLIEEYMPAGDVYNNSLKTSIMLGNYRIFDFLLDSKKILLERENIMLLIDEISRKNNVKALKKTLKDPRFNDHVYWMMTGGIADGKIDIVREMLKDPRIKGDNVDFYTNDGRGPDNVYEDESAFTMAIEHYDNHPKEILPIIKLLLKDGRADPSLNNNEHIIIASKYGYASVVKLLLDDSRVDPRAQDYAAFWKRIWKGDPI